MAKCYWESIGLEEELSELTQLVCSHWPLIGKPLAKISSSEVKSIVSSYGFVLVSSDLNSVSPTSCHWGIHRVLGNLRATQSSCRRTQSTGWRSAAPAGLASSPSCMAGLQCKVFSNGKDAGVWWVAALLALLLSVPLWRKQQAQLGTSTAGNAEQAAVSSSAQCRERGREFWQMNETPYLFLHSSTWTLPKCLSVNNRKAAFIVCHWLFYDYTKIYVKCIVVSVLLLLLSMYQL